MQPASLAPGRHIAPCRLGARLAAPLRAVTSTRLHPKAFATLLLLACMFGANHVAARVAFNHGLDVATAVAVRSCATALVVALLVWLQGVPVHLSARHRRALPAIGVLVGLQSLCLYSAVARLPVALALLAFNTFPIWTTAWAFVLHRRRPERAIVLAMPVILAGLVLALDVFGAVAGIGWQAQWAQIGTGVAFALGAALLFGLALVLTQHQVADLDGRLRTAITMAVVGLLALGGVAQQGGFHWPQAVAGWWGLALLTALYGTAFTVMFTLLPRLGVVGNSPIFNVEPVAALVLAWLLLGQRIAPVQVVGSLMVVGAVMALGLRGRR
jgi:drug/metabolite transporter (DMT)-like permease